MVDASSTPFTTKSGETISASEVSYTTGRITKQGIATYTANNPDHPGMPCFHRACARPSAPLSRLTRTDLAVVAAGDRVGRGEAGTGRDQGDAQRRGPGQERRSARKAASSRLRLHTFAPRPPHWSPAKFVTAGLAVQHGPPSCRVRR